MIKNLKNKKKGFTLIELIIVIAIIAVLAAVAIPKFGEVRKDAAFKSDIANAKTIANAATALLAEEKLTSTSYEISETAAASEISAYLQNPPSPKSKDYATGTYVVTINSGSVTVTMKSAGTGSKTTALFPIPATAAQ